MYFWKSCEWCHLQKKWVLGWLDLLHVSILSLTGEACWWTIHPASKQRSEGEKVRVGDDLILVSVSSERYLVSMGTRLRTRGHAERWAHEMMRLRKCAYEQAQLGRWLTKAWVSIWWTINNSQEGDLGGLQGRVAPWVCWAGFPPDLDMHIHEADGACSWSLLLIACKRSLIRSFRSCSL